MSERSIPNDVSKCPLCGRANECAVAAGKDAESCWCMMATVNPSALISIPSEAQGKICICERCASQTPSGA